MQYWLWGTYLQSYLWLSKCYTEVTANDEASYMRRVCAFKRPTTGDPTGEMSSVKRTGDTQSCTGSRLITSKVHAWSCLLHHRPFLRERMIWEHGKCFNFDVIRSYKCNTFREKGKLKITQRQLMDLQRCQPRPKPGSGCKY